MLDTGRMSAVESPEHEAARDCSMIVLLVAVAVVVGVRLWATQLAEFPNIVADETAYLSMGRLLGGGDGWNLGRAATYGPAYSLLLAPWTALGLSPDAQYRAAIYTNVAIAPGAFLLLEALVRRLTWLERPWSIAAALAGTLTPSLAVLSAYAWSDSLAVFAFMLVVYACVRLVDDPHVVHAGAAALAAVFAYSVHGRFAPAAVVVLFLFGVLGWKLALRRIDALIAAAVLVAGVVGVSIASGAIYGRLYEPGGQVRQTTSELGRAVRPGPMLLSVSGQFWYLLVTTAGMAGLGAIALVIASLPRSRIVSSGLECGPGAWITAALIAVSFLCSAGFMADRPGPHHLIYGRYNDAIIGLLISLGLARLATAGSPRRQILDAVAVMAATAATGLLIWWLRGDLLAQPYNGLTIRSLLALGRGGTDRVVHYTVVGVVLTGLVACFALAARKRPGTVLVVMVLLAGAGTYRGVDRTLGVRGGDPRAAIRLDGLAPSDERVAYVVGAEVSVGGFYKYPFYAPDLHLYRTTAPVWERGVRWIMASPTRADIQAAGYEIVWTDPNADQGLWRSTR